jgi:hypothetical protein
VGTVAGATPGSFTIDVRNVVTNTSLLTFSDDITPPPAVASDAAVSQLDDSFTIAQAGSYTITITDLNFPVALSSIDLIVLQQGAGVVTTNTGACSPTCTKGPFTLAAGNYDIGGFVTAAGADKAGLYSVLVSGGPGSNAVYSKAIPVGLLPTGQAVSLTAAAGTLTLSDFSNPVPLAALQARLMQGANQVATLNAAGTSSLSGATAGAGQLFTFARTGGTAAVGTYGVKLAQGTALVDDARPLPEGYSAASNVGGYRFPATISTAGAYTLQLRDYAFPANFASLRALVIQGGTQVLALSAATSSTVNLRAGPATVLVFGVPQTSTSNSLFGFALTPQPGTIPVVEQTQGVGGLFRTHNVTIATPGSYDLTLGDLQLPVSFSEVALAMTQGPTLKGQVFGGGKLTFDVPAAGVYSLNVLARLGAGASYGAYGYELSTTPPAPSITFSATPSSVVSGKTSSLQWSTTDTTICTASGGWTGSKTASGTETTSAITADSTYALSCTGPGGSVSKSVTVSLATSDGSKSGGGRLDVLVVSLLGLLAAICVLGRRRV